MNIQPLPSDIPNNAEFDYAKSGWNITALLQMLRECENQPDWRGAADVACGYIDGKQFSPQQELAMRNEGLSDLRPTNLIGRIVRGILGQEAKSRTDVKVDGDDDDEMDVVEVLNMDMKEARREAKMDMGVSGAYAGQVSIGLGWMKVDEDPDPLNYPHRARVIDRRKIWWDWQAQDPLLRDARWLVHKEWADLDELEAALPQHRKLLRNCANGWQTFSFDTTDYDLVQVNAFEDYKRFTNYRQRTEWFDTGRKRIKIYEVWYRVPAQAVVLQLGPTRNVIFDETKQSHINLVVSGKCKIIKTITSQVRMSLFAGPHRLQDIGTTRRRFPYIPFFGYRDDQDQSPYGLVEGMIGPQDEYNARRLRINWLLRARQMTIDNDALDTSANTLEEVAKMLMRPDLTIVLKADRKRDNAINIGNALAMQKEQIDVMQDAKQLIQDVPGVYGSQLGQAASGVTSGIANSLLIEQGAVAMGDLNDNYRDSRTLAHEILLDQIIDRRRQENMQVKIGRGGSRRVVVLNSFDEQGNVINGVDDAAVRVGLGEVPSTPSYRMMQQQNAATIIQALAQVNPQAAAVMVPGFIESSDAVDRVERAEEVRHLLGLPTSDDKRKQAEQQAQAKQDAAKKAAVDEQVVMLTLAEKKADIDKTTAQAEEIRSEIELNHAKTVEMGHTMGLNQRAANLPQPGQEVDPEQQMIDESLQEAMPA